MFGAQSEYSKNRQHELLDTCRRLVSGILAEQSSPENVIAAVDWCVGRLHNHQYVDTHAGEVEKSFQQLLDKFRVHSHLEAADYLGNQHSALLKCRLSCKHVEEVHAAILRTLLLLARKPMNVPLQTVRQLRNICEKRRLRSSQQRRNAHELAHDRRAILELELRQVAEGESKDWEDAWRTAPEALESSGILEDSMVLSTPQKSIGVVMDDSSRITSAETCAPQNRLPRGALPRPTWQMRAGMEIVPESTVVDMLVQMLAGCPGEFFHISSWEGGDISWDPFQVEHVSYEMLCSVLRPFIALGAALGRLRVLTSVLESLSPPFANRYICQKFTHCIADGRFDLHEIARVWHEARRSQTPGPPHFPEFQSSPEPLHILGLCWQGAGETLKDVLQDFTKDLWSFHSSLCCNTTVQGVTNLKESGPTLLKLERWVEPYSKVLTIVHDDLNAVLARLPALCRERASWSEVAAGELLSQLACLVRGNSLCSNITESNTHVESWFGRLWTGAMRPILQTMDQWAATGELHDPCDEFPSLQHSRSQSAAPILLPQLVVLGGFQVHSLRAFAEDIVMECAMQRRTEKANAATTESLILTPFTPLEVIIDSIALKPAAQLAHSAARPFLARLLLDESRGLFHHFAALRSIAFLESEDVIASFVTCLFDHVQRRTPLGAGSDSVTLELNAALAEGLDSNPDKHDSQSVPLAGSNVRRLCSQHLTLAITPEDDAGEKNSKHVTPGCVKIRYEAPPPFDRIIDGTCLVAYSAVFALLLRVRHAQSTLLLLHGLPLFGISSRLRRRWHGIRGTARFTAGLFSLAHAVDLLRTEMTNFLSCWEHYLRIDAIQEGLHGLEASLQQLAMHLASDDSSVATDFDVLENARLLHIEFLRKLSHDCLVVPSLRSVLADAEKLISLAAQLHGTLESLVQKLQRNDSGDSIDRSAEVGNESVLGVVEDEREEVLDLESLDAARAIAAADSEVKRIQREFSSGASYLLQVLMFSVARGGNAPRVSDFCLHMNFNRFYHRDI